MTKTEDFMANTLVTIQDLVAYAVFPIIGYRRKYEIYSDNPNAPRVLRSYVKLKASTKQGLKPIAARAKNSINTNIISNIPVYSYSMRGILRHYRQRAEMNLTTDPNLRPIDTRTLVDFLEGVERETQTPTP